MDQLTLTFDEQPLRPKPRREIGASNLESVLESFRDFGTPTRVEESRVMTFQGKPVAVPLYQNEFWTAKQRDSNNLHEISYRACFKSQLPAFFIERLTREGDVVYDPFMGRGTTLLEAALLGRIPAGSDINPLSVTLIRPRLRPPTLGQIHERLESVDWSRTGKLPEELLVFYHPKTLAMICALRSHIQRQRKSGDLDALDEWIAMVSMNRLTGHSNGFFSVYSLPPNQAVSVQSQRKINARLKQTPPPRDVAALILKKSKFLLADCSEVLRQRLCALAGSAILITGPAAATPEIASESVDLVVTSPPFLNVVDYALDNWLRCWFLGIDVKSVKLTTPRKLETWQDAMTAVFKELRRVLRPGGHVAFEVGEVGKGKVRLEEAVLPCGVEAGLEPRLVMINSQKFTKTANCWGVDNNSKGTNSNRIVVFRKSR